MKGIDPAPRIHFILDSSLAIPCLSLRVVGYSFLHWLNPLLVSELGFSLLSLGFSGRICADFPFTSTGGGQSNQSIWRHHGREDSSGKGAEKFDL